MPGGIPGPPIGAAGIPGGGVPGAAIAGAGIPGGVPGPIMPGANWPGIPAAGPAIPGGGPPIPGVGYGIPEPGPAIAPGPGIPGPGIPGPGIPGPGIPCGTPPVAASSFATEPGRRCSCSHAEQNSVCFLLIGKSGIQNSVNFVVNLRSTCSDAFPHWPHINCSTASTLMYVFQP
jgi:hypothetical protein